VDAGDQVVVQVLMVRALMGQVLMDQARMGQVLMALVMREVPVASVQMDDKVLQVDVALEVTVVSPADVVLMDMVQALEAVQVVVSVHVVGLELVGLAAKVVRAEVGPTVRVVQVALARVEVGQVEISLALAPLLRVRQSLCLEWVRVAAAVAAGLMVGLAAAAGLAGLVAVAGLEGAAVWEALEGKEEGWIHTAWEMEAFTDQA